VAVRRLSHATAPEAVTRRDANTDLALRYNRIVMEVPGLNAGRCLPSHFMQVLGENLQTVLWSEVLCDVTPC
jgi:hypothetical protein